MLRDLYKYMCVSLAALLAAACADLPETTEVPDPQEPRYMTFDISEIDTKVSDSDLTSYEFSIWIFDPDKKSDPSNPLVDGDKVKLRYDSASGRWRFHDGSSFIDVPWRDGIHDFFVVSSYDLAGTSEKIHFDKSRLGYTSLFQLTQARFVVPAMNMMNSSDGSDYNYYKDILYAAASRDVRTEDGYKPVSLTLRHLWPALEFNMINETDQNKYITDFSVSNFRVNSNTTIEFSASSGYTATPPSNNSDDFADNKYEVEEVFVLGPGEQRSVFGMPVMVFPQKFVSYVNSAILSFSVDGVKTTKSFFVVGSDGLSTQEWNPGTLYSYDIRLKTAADPVVISPTASIEHVKDANGVLTHSALTLNLNLDDAKLSRVKDLTVVVSKDGVEYLNQTFATVSSNEMTLYKGSVSDPGRFYMPKVDEDDEGDRYQVTLTYNDGFYDQEVTCQAKSPAPNYTLNLNFTATTTDVTIHSATVSISENVLAEVPLAPDNSNDLWIRFAGSSSAIFRLSHLDPSKSVFVSEKPLASAPYSYNGIYYTLGCFIRFDGVEGSVTYTTINTMNGSSVTPVKYKRLRRLSSASELLGGTMYILEASRLTKNYWSVGADGRLEFSSEPSSFDDIPGKYVFKYMVDDKKSVSMEPGYFKYSLVGAWYSVSTGKYMNEGDDPSYFNSSSPVRYVKCGTGWGSIDGNEFDISKGYIPDVAELLRYGLTSDKVFWGTNKQDPNQYWKWYIYEVVYE